MRWHDEWLLLPERLALHEASATAVLADAHLGYGDVRRRQGDALPFGDIATELAPLIKAAARHRIARLVVAGDLFERGYDATICCDFLDVLARLQIELVALVPGNHDGNLATTAPELPVFATGYELAGWHIVHGDQPVAAPRAVMGHWHPAVRVGRRKVPCFLARQSHLILPAFSLDAAGVDVGREARWRDWDCRVIEGDLVQEGASCRR
jgi:metallophosphoesterase superfamily enzyme